MKLSNKILLGAFLFIVLLLTGLHAALRIKFERGDLVALYPPKKNKVQKVFNNVRNVVITGMGRLNILPSDTTKVSLHPGLEGSFNFYMSGDTLMVDGKFNENEYKAGRKNYLSLDLYLPAMDNITLRYTEANLSGVADSLLARSYNITMYNSRLRLQRGKNSRLPACWNELNVQCNYSSIVFIDSSRIRNMQLTLLNSSNLRDEKASFENFSLQMDSTSSADLHEVNLEKLVSRKE